mmetsp:Transcript_58809/g.191808  ORF Transcript_58809/g.191808 Transcript_58809/m.191808 type:complete len:395 (-) Transcript_58809:2441-3625(-)
MCCAPSAAAGTDGSRATSVAAADTAATDVASIGVGAVGTLAVGVASAVVVDATSIAAVLVGLNCRRLRWGPPTGTNGAGSCAGAGRAARRLEGRPASSSVVPIDGTPRRRRRAPHAPAAVPAATAAADGAGAPASATRSRGRPPSASSSSAAAAVAAACIEARRRRLWRFRRRAASVAAAAAAAGATTTATAGTSAGRRMASLPQGRPPGSPDTVSSKRSRGRGCSDSSRADGGGLPPRGSPGRGPGTSGNVEGRRRPRAGELAARRPRRGRVPISTTATAAAAAAPANSCGRRPCWRREPDPGASPRRWSLANRTGKASTSAVSADRGGWCRSAQAAAAVCVAAAAGARQRWTRAVRGKVPSVVVGRSCSSAVGAIAAAMCGPRDRSTLRTRT